MLLIINLKNEKQLNWWGILKNKSTKKKSTAGFSLLWALRIFVSMVINKLNYGYFFSQFSHILTSVLHWFCAREPWDIFLPYPFARIDQRGQKNYSISRRNFLRLGFLNYGRKLGLFLRFYMFLLYFVHCVILLQSQSKVFTVKEIP